MMNEVGVVTAKKHPLLPRWAKFLLMLVGMLLFLAAGAWVLLDIVTRQHVGAALAETRALGWPTEIGELYPEPIPPSENAALLYNQAFASLQGTDEDWDLATDISRPEDLAALTDEEQTQLDAFLKNNAPVLELLHRAAQLEKCQFDLDYRHMGPATLLSHLTEMRRCLRWKRLAAILALADGHTEEALEHWLDSVAMVRHQEGQRILDAELTRQGCLYIASYTLEALIQSGQLNEAQLTQALGSLEGIEVRRSFVDGLRRQMLLVSLQFAPSPEVRAQLGVPSSIWDVVKIRLGWASVTEPLPGDLQPVLYWLYFGSLLGRPWRQHDHATYLARHLAIVGLADRPYYEVRGALDRPEFAAPDWIWLGYPLYLTATPLATAFVPELGYTQVRFARLEARAAAARTDLALELYRLAHGDYPDALTDLTPDLLPEVPLDPFDGEPIRYIKEDGRVVVYSVGTNLQDDGGSEEQGLSRRPKDIVFTVRRAPTPTEEADDE